MASVSRNAPCPCGSGKKYKHCHLGVDEVEERGEAVGGAWGWIAIAVVAIAMGIGGGVWKGATTGGGIGLAAGFALIIIKTIMGPPPAKGGGDAGAINFGTK